MEERRDQRRRRRRALLDVNERLCLIEQNVTGFAIFVIDVDGHIASWNLGAEAVLGYKRSQIMGQPYGAIFTPEDQERGEDAVELLRARTSGCSEDERWHVRGDGSRIWGSGTVTALYDRGGALRGYAKIVRDQTEHRRLQQEIELLNARLQGAMVETHHRVKNNLQIISAMIDLQTLDREDAVPVSEYRRLSRQVCALAAVHDILTADTRRGSERSVLSVKALLERLTALMQVSHTQVGIVSDVEDALLSTQKAVSLALIANELASNAAKYGRSEVAISLRRQDGAAVLTVRDDGPGFPEEFDPSRAAHTGLMLVTNLTTVDLRGEVQFHNAPESGGCVSIRFPVADEE